MKTINLSLSLLLLVFLVACGGGETSESETTESQQQQEMEGTETMAEDIRTIDIIGIDAMKFAVESEMEGITVGGSTAGEGDLILLETIEVQPGEEIRIRLTTRSDLPKSAMAHNWVLMVLGADANTYVSEASKAMDEDYTPRL